MQQAAISNMTYKDILFLRNCCIERRQLLPFYYFFPFLFSCEFFNTGFVLNCFLLLPCVRTHLLS